VFDLPWASWSGFPITETMVVEAQTQSSLAALRLRLIPWVAREADQHGWGAIALDNAIVQAGVQVGVECESARQALPGAPSSLLQAWFEYTAAEMARALPPDALVKLKIRDRITQLLEARLRVLGSNRKALKKALHLMSRPSMARQAAAHLWKAADEVWCLAGDTSTDYNRYTKRSLVCAIYAATLRVLADDTTPDMRPTREYLARRIDNVMQIEKVKRLGKQRAQEVRDFLS
jgi:ubiquinone biosynthesis protein COQ9